MKVVVHVDGGSRGNPGPAAAAAVVSTPEGKLLEQAAVKLGTTTNNVAEYRGLLLGLQCAKELGATEVEIINDSELIARQVNGDYRVKHPAMRELYLDAVAALRGFDNWSVRSVPRAENAEADRLVNETLDGSDHLWSPSANGSARSGDQMSSSVSVDDAKPESSSSQKKQVTGSPSPARLIGPTDYEAYLLIDDLLQLQQPLTSDAHDEMLFIIVHQAYELWFKLVIHELTKARDELVAGRPAAAVGPLRRVVAVERLLLEQLNVLETMGPEGFLEFRDPLAPASGFQSQQFREIEWISGLRDTWRADKEPPAGASLYDAFCEACRTGGIGLAQGDDEVARAKRIKQLAELYRDHVNDTTRSILHQIAESLIDHDESLAKWRFQHTLMAAREIGARQGTGGSRGVEYLRTTIDRRCFPELWEVRTAL